MKNLSSWVFRVILLFLVASFVLFFLNPGFIVQLYVLYYIYFIPFFVALILIDYFFNKNINKKYFYLSIIIIFIFISLKFVLEYWFNNSFNILAYFSKVDKKIVGIKRILIGKLPEPFFL
ncbi:MAG: hypothetical protein WCW93_02680 [Candidatus Paceibacterota bacterium]